MLCQLTEILVKGKQNTLLASGQRLRIAATRSVISNPDDVISGRPKCPYRFTGEILIGEKTHLKPRSGTLSPHSVRHAHRRDTQ